MVEKKTYNINKLKSKDESSEENNKIVKMVTNKLLELLILEISKSDMKHTIKTKLIHPLLYLLYCQLYPYLYAFVIVLILMFIMLVVIMIFFIIKIN